MNMHVSNKMNLMKIHFINSLKDLLLVSLIIELDHFVEPLFSITFSGVE